jgi:hypothetical protein
MPAPPPADLQENPYLPAGPPPLLMEEFQGINTSTTRAGVDAKQCYWIDGFYPIDRRNLRTMWGVGPALYTATGGLTIVMYAFANIGALPYAIVFLSDGSVVAVRTDTGAVTTIMTAGTILSPSIQTIGVSQWGRQYVIIVSGQANGYWLWDGSLLYGAGTLAPGVTLTNVGSSYVTAPGVLASGGSGSGARFVATIANGVVTGVSMGSPGSGYQAGESVSLVFSGGNSTGSGGSVTAALSLASGSGASLTAVLVPFGNTFTISQISVVAGGSGYSQFAAATLTDAPSNTHVQGGQIGVVLTISGGVITAAVPSYQSGITATYRFSTPVPTVAVNDTGLYYVSSTSIVAPGAGYSGGVRLVATGGGTPTAQATFRAQVNAGGSITSVQITNPGVYGSNVAPTITISDTFTIATGTIQLMPFGIQGTAVQPYAGRVWVVNGASGFFTAPGSVSDFATSDGGGNFISSDSFLRVFYSQLIQTNGFLYLLGDSSLNYISGVQTSGIPPTTTYSNQNADPQVGTPYASTGDLFGRNIVFANSFGVHASYGGAVSKISEALDGVWGSVANFGGLQLSAANATIFGKRVWCVLSQIVDPVSGATVNKLFLWDGKKWWASAQDVSLTFIQHQEINSVFTAWGTDGTRLYPLFQTPTSGFTKTVQSRLWDEPGGYLLQKTPTRFWALAQYYSTVSTNLTVNFDNEQNAYPYAAPTGSARVTITGPSGAGYFVTPLQAVGQAGVLAGMTIQTTAADMALISAMLGGFAVSQYRG